MVELWGQLVYVYAVRTMRCGSDRVGLKTAGARGEKRDEDWALNSEQVIRRDRGRQTLSMVHNEHPLKQQINRGPRAPCRFARLHFLLRLVYILIGILINGIVSVDVRSEVVNHDGSRMCVGDCQNHTVPQLAPSPSLSLITLSLSLSLSTTGYRPVPRPSLVTRSQYNPTIINVAFHGFQFRSINVISWLQQTSD